MSLDDMIQDESSPPPTVCDECHEQLQRTGPTGLGWQLLVFDCTRCGKMFCHHFDAADGGNVCSSCAELQKAGTRWPTIPLDATAQDPLHPTEPTEYFQEGSGPGMVTLIVLIAIVILIAVAYLALITGQSGGVR